MTDSCPVCNGYGLVHPVSDTGKVAWGRVIYCQCQGDRAGKPYPRPEPEDDDGRYRPPAPEDIDYPVSYDYYRGLCRYHGWPDPGPDTCPDTLAPLSVPELPQDELQQIKGELAYLRGQIVRPAKSKAEKAQSTRQKGGIAI